MALALVDAFAYVHGHDFTCDSNQIQLDQAVAQLDATTFCSGGWTEQAPGVKSATMSMAGFWTAGADSVDEVSAADLGVVNRVVTVGLDATNGAACYMLQAGHFNYQLGGTHGELAPFSLTAAGTNGVGVIRGALAHAKAAVSSTGALGVGVELGQVAADEYLYGTFHIFGTPGTTITVVLESDGDDTFASATTRATFGPLTTAGGTWATRVGGAITDTHYRLRVTAITGTFTVAGAIGIG